jgi:biotin transporter BioY
MHGLLDLLRAEALAETPKAICIAASLLVLYAGWTTLRHQIMKRYTAVPDLKYLRKARKAPKLAGTCFIAGGSISGLLAASVCSKHYEKVVMVGPVMRAPD